MAEAKKSTTPVLEWAAAAIGLVLTVALLIVLVREALAGERDGLPAVAVTVERVVERDGLFVVEVRAINNSGATASDVEIEASLTSPGAAPVVSSATIDYVPGHSHRRAGLFFHADPRAGQLEVRALGYEEP